MMGWFRRARRVVAERSRRLEAARRTIEDQLLLNAPRVSAVEAEYKDLAANFTVRFNHGMDEMDRKTVKATVRRVCGMHDLNYRLYVVERYDS